MSAYVIANVEVKDPEGYRAYVEAVPATLEQYGGKYLVRGGATFPQEGEWYPRVVVMEFADAAAAQRWYDSPEYQAVIGIRHATAEGRLMIVEGV